MRRHPYYNKARKTWTSILQRCYDKKIHQIEETYTKCEICDEWKVFKNYYDWFINNYYELPNEVVQIDKDILDKGNKIYAPEKCCFVPHSINSLLTKSNKARGDCPIGVSYIKRDKCFRAQCNVGKKKRIGVGSFSNPYDAFLAYKKKKEQVIKDIADLYKDVISPEVYKALYEYKVEITD